MFLWNVHAFFGRQARAIGGLFDHFFFLLEFPRKEIVRRATLKIRLFRKLFVSENRFYQRGWTNPPITLSMPRIHPVSLVSGVFTRRPRPRILGAHPRAPALPLPCQVFSVTPGSPASPRLLSSLDTQVVRRGEVQV